MVPAWRASAVDRTEHQPASVEVEADAQAMELTRVLAELDAIERRHGPRLVGRFVPEAAEST